MKRKLFLLLCALLTSVGVQQVRAQASYNHTYTEGVTVAAGGDYFLYNIASGMFLTDGMDYGTRASIDHAGRVITLATSGSGYTINTTPFSGNGTDLKAGGVFLNNAGIPFVDGTSAEWTFEPVSVDGYTNAYAIKTGDKYLYIEYADNLYSDGTYPNPMGALVSAGSTTSDTKSYWLLIPMSDRQAVGDYTYLLRNGDFNHPWEYKIWTNAAGWTNIAGGKKENACAEMYGRGFDINQTISATVDNGRYKLYNQAFYNNSDANNQTYLYANSDQSAIAILNAHGESTTASMTGASDAFTAGYYVNSVETFVSDGKLKVGIKNATTAGNAWSIMDNFYLEYLGQCIMDYAVALPDGGAMAADTWYYFDVETAGGYIMTATKLDDIVYTTDGYAQIDGVSTTLSSPATLSVTRYYVKSSSGNELTYVIDSYDLTEEIAAYNTAVTNANTAKTNAEAAAKVNASEKSALDDAIATYTGEGAKAVDVEGTQNSAMKAALEEATPALVSATNAVNASINAYEGAATKLAAMKELVDATNVYTPDGLNTYYTTPKGKYDAGTLTTEEANALQNPFTKTGWRATNTTVDDFLMSAWNETTLQWDSYHVNTWSGEGDSDGSNFKVPFIEFWADDKTSLGTKTMTATITGLSANSEYAVSAWVRVRQTNDQTKVPESITLQVGDGEAVDVTGGTQVGNTQFYLGKYTAGGSTDNDGNLTIKFNVAASSNISWLAFQNVKYDYVAGTADYNALQAAIDAKETNTLGFETGEYAPYNNVGLLTALANAKAIDKNATNQKSVVNAVTAALEAASWSDANATEVNAFYKGDFAGYAEDTATPLDYTPNGWTATDNFRLMLANTETYPGLSTASATRAVMSWSGGITYGEQVGYEMPLAAHTIYELTFKAAGWDGQTRGDLTVSVKRGSEGMVNMNLGNADKDIAGKNVSAGLTSFSVFFATGDAGNYVFSISSPNNMVLTDFDLRKAASQTLTFADNAAMPKYAPGTYPSVKITRTLTAGKWATAVYPFAVSGVDEIAVLDSYDNETGVVGFTSAAASTANEPFLMRSTAGTAEISLSNVAVVATAAEPVVTKNDASLKGVYTSGTVSEEANVVRYVVSNNQLYKVDSDVNIKPFRAYFELADGNSSARLSFNFDDATAINAIEAVDAEAGALKDGKYLENGKIVIVKNGVKYSANGQILK